LRARFIDLFDYEFYHMRFNMTFESSITVIIFILEILES